MGESFDFVAFKLTGDKLTADLPYVPDAVADLPLEQRVTEQIRESGSSAAEADAQTADMLMAIFAAAQEQNR